MNLFEAILAFLWAGCGILAAAVVWHHAGPMRLPCSVFAGILVTFLAYKINSFLFVLNSYPECDCGAPLRYVQDEANPSKKNNGKGAMHCAKCLQKYLRVGSRFLKMDKSGSCYAYKTLTFWAGWVDDAASSQQTKC